MVNIPHSTAVPMWTHVMPATSQFFSNQRRAHALDRGVRHFTCDSVRDETCINKCLQAFRSEWTANIVPSHYMIVKRIECRDTTISITHNDVTNQGSRRKQKKKTKKRYLRTDTSKGKNHQHKNIGQACRCRSQSIQAKQAKQMNKIDNFSQPKKV